MLYWPFRFDNEIPVNCLFTQWKWPYILDFKLWRWSALNMGFVVKWFSKMQGQCFFRSWAGWAAVFGRVQKFREDHPDLTTPNPCVSSTAQISEVHKSATLSKRNSFSPYRRLIARLSRSELSFWPLQIIDRRLIRTWPSLSQKRTGRLVIRLPASRRFLFGFCCDCGFRWSWSQRSFGCCN